MEYLTQRYAAKAGKKITEVSGRAMELLRSYAWPGNVRELQNVIQRAVILSEGTRGSTLESKIRSLNIDKHRFKAG